MCESLSLSLSLSLSPAHLSHTLFWPWCHNSWPSAPRNSTFFCGDRWKLLKVFGTTEVVDTATQNQCKDALRALQPHTLLSPACARERDRSLAPNTQRVRACGHCVQPNWWSRHTDPSLLGVDRYPPPNGERDYRRLKPADEVKSKVLHVPLALTRRRGAAKVK